MNVRGTTTQQVRLNGRAPHRVAPVDALNSAATDLKGRVDAVATIAAAHAEAVDLAARFPREAIDAARSQCLLGIQVPHDLGGEGASMSDVIDVCYALGRACSSTAMVYAMHQTKVALIVRHARASAWHERLLRRLSTDQLLLASSTTEGQAGGDVRKSAAAVEQLNDHIITLERSATVMSYGEEAD